MVMVMMDPSWQLPYDKKKIPNWGWQFTIWRRIWGGHSWLWKKSIVFDSCISKLLKRGPECGYVIAQCERKATGSMLSVQLTCHSGHMINWDSQPVVNRKPLRNLLLAASILFTGNTFAAINRLASCLNFQFFSESGFLFFFYFLWRTTKVLVPCDKWCLGSWKTETTRYSKC